MDNVPAVTVKLQEDITAGHKFAIKEIKKDEPVIKYGYPIGAAKEDIAVGMHVHVHNIHTLLSDSASYTYDENKAQAAYSAWKAETAEQRKNVPTVNVYKRPDGKFGIQNYICLRHLHSFPTQRSADLGRNCYRERKSVNRETV